MEIQARSEKLEEFAGRFWAVAGDQRKFAFHGEMGAGKTTLISALCRFRGVSDITSSPTFSIINEYAYPGGRIYHMDLYRLKDEEEVVQAGVEDCWYSDAICMVEWPERAPGLFGEETVHVVIRPVDEGLRMVDVRMPASML
jgi:tRNA threonylcarbamoyladenosine biosynthesis protein TsaE